MYRNWKGKKKRDYGHWIIQNPADVVTTTNLPIVLNADYTSTYCPTDKANGGQGTGPERLSDGAVTTEQPQEFRQNQDTGLSLRDGHSIGSTVQAGFGSGIAAPDSRLESLLNLNLNANMFVINPDSTSNYLVETNPRLTDYRQWVSSDYMLKKLGVNPDAILKRLGDGFYEQRLVREQINNLTGTRFLDSYTSDEDQYRSLMTAGADFAEEFKLKVGVALSADMMARLTSDLVWLEYVTVDTATGPQQVLMPKVYLAPGRESLIDPKGTLASAKTVKLNLRDDFHNSGTVFGSESVSIAAVNIENSGDIAGKLVSLAALKDISSVGGAITGVELVDLKAGGDITVASSVGAQVREGALNFAENRYLDRLGSVTVTGSDGVLKINAGRDLNIMAGAVNSAGSATLIPGRDLTVGVVATKNEFQENSQNRLKEGQEVGTMIQAAKGLSLEAGRDLAITGGKLYSDGQIDLRAGHDVNIDEGRQTRSFERYSVSKSKGFLSKKQETFHSKGASDVALGAEVSGEKVNIVAGNDFALRGSTVAASEGLSVAAGGAIAVSGADNYSDSYSFHETKKSGFSASFGGGQIGIGYNKTQKSDAYSDQSHTITGSLLGSEKGEVSLYAGKDAGIHASKVVAGAGNIAISGENVAIDHQYETYEHWEQHKFKQSGINLSLGLGGAAGKTISQGFSAVDTIQRASQAKTSRAATLFGIAAARDLYDAGNSLVPGVKEVAGNGIFGKGGSGLSVNIGFSKSKSESTYASKDQVAVGSHLSSGGNTTIVARGKADGEGTHPGTGDLNIIGSVVEAGGKVKLAANNDINLLSAKELSSSANSNSNSSSGVGVSFGIGGQGFGPSLNAHASKGKGHGDSFGITHAETIIYGKEGVEFSSVNDTTLKGAQIIGEKVTGNVGGNLTIISEQDLFTETQRQSSRGGNLSVGVGGSSFGGGFNSQKQKGDSNYASVNEQSGIFAGKEGFDITVGGHTGLTGAVIASEAEAEKNKLATGSISAEDIHNHAKYQATTKGWGGEFSYVKNPLPGDKNVNTGSISPGLPMKDKGKESSVTKSAVAEGTVTITDDAAQLAKTGQTADEALTDLNRDTASAHQGPLGKNPDLRELFEKQAELAEAAACAGKAVATTVGDISQRMLIKTGDKGWQEGGIYKVILQGAGAALIAQLGNGEGLQAALGAMASQLAAKNLAGVSRSLAEDMSDNPMAVELLTNMIQNSLSTVIGVVVGGESGGNLASAMDRNNRQLHEKEIAWIKENAEDFAKLLLENEVIALGDELSYEQAVTLARQLLSQQGLMSVDTWASIIYNPKYREGTPEEIAKLVTLLGWANAYLDNARNSYSLKIDNNGEKQSYFTPWNGAQSKDPLYFSEWYTGVDNENMQFLKDNVHVAKVRGSAFEHNVDYVRQKATSFTSSIQSFLNKGWMRAATDAYVDMERNTDRYVQAGKDLAIGKIHSLIAVGDSAALAFLDELYNQPKMGEIYQAWCKMELGVDAMGIYAVAHGSQVAINEARAALARRAAERAARKSRLPGSASTTPGAKPGAGANPATPELKPGTGTTPGASTGIPNSGPGPGTVQEKIDGLKVTPHVEPNKWKATLPGDGKVFVLIEKKTDALIISDWYQGGLPSGSGAPLLTQTIQESGVTLGNRVILNNVVNPATRAVFEAGGDAASSLLGKSLTKSLEQLGRPPKSMHFQQVGDKLSIVVKLH